MHLKLNSKAQRHACFWLFYLFYFFAVNALGNGKLSLGVAAITVCYCALIFYAVYFTLHYFFRKGRILMAVVLLTCFYVLSGILVYYVLYGNLGLQIINNTYTVSSGSFRWTRFIQTFIVMNSNYTIMAMGYYYYVEKLREVGQKLAAVEKQLEAESNMKDSQYTTLSAQVHPHMMANIFNHLKKKITPNDPELASQIGEIYQLILFYMEAQDVAGASKILLSDEIMAVERYLSIQEQVEMDSFYIQLRCSGNLMRFGIAPTTLQTLAGNLFKHADIWDREHPASIDIVVEHRGYMIRVKNRKRPGRQTMPSHGVGLRNVRKRMEYLFAENFFMSEMQDEQTYELTLRVELFKN